MLLFMHNINFLRRYKVMDFIEKKARLKYMYFIDTDKLMTELKQDSVYINFCTSQDSDPTDLLHLIFANIVSVSKKYSAYILTDEGVTSHSFFSEDVRNPSIKTDFFLAGLSIFNHCIIRSFLRSLETNTISSLPESKYDPTTSMIPLSNKNVNSIRLGYLASEKLCCLDKVSKTSSSGFENMYQRFYANTDRLSYKKLLKLGTIMERGDSQKKSQPPLCVKKSESNPALFLLYNKEVRKFDKALLGSSFDDFKILERYTELYRCSIEWKGFQKFNEDHILFDQIIERIYDFSFNSYLFTLYSDGANTESDNSLSAKDLFGETFSNIVQKYATTAPMTYNKSIFLKYAVEAVLNSKTLVSSYPSLFKDGLSYDTDTHDSILSAPESLKLITAYYRTLRHITIPLVEDLWDILTDERMLGFEISRKSFQSFIKKYFHILTCDYARITSDNDFMEELEINKSAYALTYRSLFDKLDVKLREMPISNIASYDYIGSLDKKLRVPKNVREASTHLSPYLKRDSILENCSSNEELMEMLMLPVPHPSSTQPLSKDIKTFHDNHLTALLGVVHKYNPQELSH